MMCRNVSANISIVRVTAIPPKEKSTTPTMLKAETKEKISSYFTLLNEE